MLLLRYPTALMRRSRGILSLLGEREGSSGPLLTTVITWQPLQHMATHLLPSETLSSSSVLLYLLWSVFPPWEILHKPSTSEKQTGKRAFVSMFTQTYLFENRASTTLELNKTLNSGTVAEASLCSPQSSSGGHAPSWGGLVLASSLWGLQASWPPLDSSVHENGWPMVPCWFSAFISCPQSHWNSFLFISPPCQEHLEPQSCPLGFVTLPTSWHPHTRRTCTLFHHLSHWGRCLMVLGTGLTPMTCHLCLPS